MATRTFRLAVAIFLEAVKNGARAGVHITASGERAGKASLEELVMPWPGAAQAYLTPFCSGSPEHRAHSPGSAPRRHLTKRSALVSNSPDDGFQPNKGDRRWPCLRHESGNTPGRRVQRTAYTTDPSTSRTIRPERHPASLWASSVARSRPFGSGWRSWLLLTPTISEESLCPLQGTGRSQNGTSPTDLESDRQRTGQQREAVFHPQLVQVGATAANCSHARFTLVDPNGGERTTASIGNRQVDASAP